MPVNRAPVFYSPAVVSDALCKKAIAATDRKASYGISKVTCTPMPTVCAGFHLTHHQQH